MPVNSHCRAGLLACAAAGLLALAACSSVTEHTRSALDTLAPYKIEVVQGNFVSKEQVEQLKPGMTRQQVREILGTSLLSDVFHSNRWDYVFTIRRPGVESLERHLTVYFNGELLDRYEGDPMPSEQDFVAQLDTRKLSGKKAPNLEATPQELEKYAPSKDAKAKDGDTATASADPPPLPVSYPPLESR